MFDFPPVDLQNSGMSKRLKYSYMDEGELTKQFNTLRDGAAHSYYRDQAASALFNLLSPYIDTVTASHSARAQEAGVEPDDLRQAGAVFLLEQIANWREAEKPGAMPALRATLVSGLRAAQRSLMEDEWNSMNRTGLAAPHHRADSAPQPADQVADLRHPDPLGDIMDAALLPEQKSLLDRHYGLSHPQDEPMSLADIAAQDAEGKKGIQPWAARVLAGKSTSDALSLAENRLRQQVLRNPEWMKTVERMLNG